MSNIIVTFGVLTLAFFCSCIPVEEKGEPVNSESADHQDKSDVESDAVILGMELRSATDAEEQWKEKRGDKPRLIDGDYDFFRGELDLLNPAPSQLDAKVRSLCRRYVEANDEERSELRAALSMDEFYVLIFFGERAAVFALRESDPDFIADGLSGLAMIERDRVDFRDIVMSLALLYHSAAKVSDDPNKMFREAAALAEPGVAELFTNFIEGPEEYRDLQESWGYAEVKTTYGIGLIGWGFAEYEPTTNLAKVAVEIRQLISQDKYYPDSIKIASTIPPVWLGGGVDEEINKVLTSVRGGASVSGSLRPSEHVAHNSQQFSVFLVETADPADVQILLKASKVKVPGHCKLGVAEGNLFCLIVARSFVQGDEAFETDESLKRFSGDFGEVLKRYAD